MKLREAKQQATRASITIRKVEPSIPDVTIKKGKKQGKMTRQEYAVAVLGLGDVSTAMSKEKEAKKEAKKNR